MTCTMLDHVSCPRNSQPLDFKQKLFSIICPFVQTVGNSDVLLWLWVEENGLFITNLNHTLKIDITLNGGTVQIALFSTLHGDIVDWDDRQKVRSSTWC